MPTLKQVLEKNPDTVKIVFKNFPLRRHKLARKAAAAALAAGSEGKFWEFHDMLFENVSSLSREKLTEIAERLGLDAKAFKEKLEDPQFALKINQDLRQGIVAGVQGTPAVFVNGRLLANRSLSGFQSSIDKALSEQDIKPK